MAMLPSPEPPKSIRNAREPEYPVRFAVLATSA